MTIEIHQLSEAGEDGGSLMGYYAKGHHDRHDFAIASNIYSEAMSAYDSRHVLAKDVRHIWWRNVPMAGQPGCHRFVPAEPRARGAYAVTVWDHLYASRFAEIQRQCDDARRQREYGFSDGFNWALRQLDWIDKDAGEKLLAHYREDPSHD